MPILNNNLLLLHVAQLKDMLSLGPFLLSCYYFIEFKQKKKKKKTIVEVATGLFHKPDHVYAHLL